MFIARTVVEDGAVTGFIERHQKKRPRLEEAYEGIKWRLARAPESGLKIDESGKYLLKTADMQPIMPGLRVLYTFDEHSVTIEAIDFGQKTAP